MFSPIYSNKTTNQSPKKNPKHPLVFWVGLLLPLCCGSFWLGLNYPNFSLVWAQPSSLAASLNDLNFSLSSSTQNTYNQNVSETATETTIFPSQSTTTANSISTPEPTKALEIPPHINLLDFYQTYSQRLFGDESVKIISREEWGDQNFFSNNPPPNLKMTIYDGEGAEYDYDYFNNLEDFFSSRLLTLNYQNNFLKYDESFMQNRKIFNGVNYIDYQYLPVEEIVIHHTAGAFTSDMNSSRQELERIYLLHTQERKWHDFAYHYFIDGSGNIYEGIIGGKYALGTHTYYHNHGTLAIALMGDFRPGHDQLNSQMIESLAKLINYLIKEYKIDTSKQQYYLRKPDLSTRQSFSSFIRGHQELDVIPPITACPGVSPQTLRDILQPLILSSSSPS